ncbi:MAG TPA: polyprenyl diphosphate synthase [Vitreimonas sp.]|nr:polyprenyl diphosphate synthase [Vitreimonas sp.]
MSNNIVSDKVPQHIALIMDGNRRWAKQHKLEALRGHEYVANQVIEPLVEHCIARGVKYLTLWAFSTENWGREKSEVEGLMNLFRHAFTKNAEQLHAKGVRLNTIGDLSRFPIDIHDNIQKWLETSKNNQRITVTFALNYGGRDELVRAINHLLAEGAKTISAEEISAHLDTAAMPDPDLIIRPGGEQRLSGLLPWQSVYAELYFTDVLMPDFSPAELDKALAEYGHRARRFGK